MKQLRQRLAALVGHEEDAPQERDRLLQLMLLFIELPPPPDPEGDFPHYERYRSDFLRHAAGDDGEALEEAFLTLYAHLHMHEARYTPPERLTMDRAGGYWAHAGGLSPILKAAPWIDSDTVSLDLGAANGLQGLLLQRLYPHKRTIQVEISSHMVEIGRRLQRWLGIPPERVDWVTGDVCDHFFEPADFIYLYRPVRPTTGAGARFYRRLAEFLATSRREVIVFSIADCLKDFLTPGCEIFYNDGHLTCFRSTPQSTGDSSSTP